MFGKLIILCVLILLISTSQRQVDEQLFCGWRQYEGMLDIVEVFEQLAKIIAHRIFKNLSSSAVILSGAGTRSG